MESKYHYFKRDISWLSFNHRVLLEADDDSLPLYERINFVSIYSSNLEEFYKIRVAEHKAIASGGHSDDITQEEAKHLTDSEHVKIEYSSLLQKESFIDENKSRLES